MNIVVTMAPDGWTAHHGELAVGRSAAFVRPDDRCSISFDSWRAEAYGPLAQAVAQHFQRDLHTVIDESDGETHRHLTESGFTVHRREHVYSIPTDPAITGLSDPTAPPGIEVVTADQVDEDRLRELDDELRQDVPGASGWRWTPQGFREQTYDSPSFDPATYLVAIERSTGRYAGLVRVWNDPGGPRLGLIATGRPYRRQGLATVLLARTFAVLHERGKTDVAAEADVANTGSNTLLTGLGARRIGGSIELIFPRSAAHPV
jgi:RimJ/RimL family protein N-acetyltransferase